MKLVEAIPYMMNGVVEKIYLDKTEEKPYTKDVTMVVQFVKGKLVFFLKSHEEVLPFPVQVMNAEDLTTNWIPIISEKVAAAGIDNEEKLTEVLPASVWKQYPLLRGLQWLAEGEKVTIESERKGDERTIHINTEDGLEDSQKEFRVRADYGTEGWEAQLYILTESDIRSNWKITEIGERV